MNEKITFLKDIKISEDKRLRIGTGDICDAEGYDLVVCSAFINDYTPFYRTLIGALHYQCGISVEALSICPMLNLKSVGGWLAETKKDIFKYLMCIEICDLFDYSTANEESVKGPFTTFEHILEYASTKGIKIKKVILPLLGNGDEDIEPQFIIPQLLYQCKKALICVPELEEIAIVERRKEKAEFIVNEIEKTEVVSGSSADTFISYSSAQQDIAYEYCDALNKRGRKCWMAPDSIPAGSDYPDEIGNAIDRIKSLVVLLSPNTNTSKWVPKEVNAAINSGKIVIPCMLQDYTMSNNFKFYFSNVHIHKAWEFNPDETFDYICKEMEKQEKEAEQLNLLMNLK